MHNHIMNKFIGVSQPHTQLNEVQWNFSKPAISGTRENGWFLGVAGFVKNGNVFSELSPFIVGKVLCIYLHDHTL